MGVFKAMKSLGEVTIALTCALFLEIQFARVSGVLADIKTNWPSALRTTSGIISAILCVAIFVIVYAAVLTRLHSDGRKIEEVKRNA